MAKDIHFQGVPQSDVTGYKIFTFGYETALKVDGAQSLVNRWAKTFVTPKGSDPLEPNAGTVFGSLYGANVSQQADIQDIVFLAISDANTQVKAQDIVSMHPPEERLQSAALITYSPSPETAGFEVWIKIVNQAGTKANLRFDTGVPR